jgi:hypothetical protein
MTDDEPKDTRDFKTRMEDMKKAMEEGKGIDVPDEVREAGRKLRRMPGVRRTINILYYGLIFPSLMIMSGQGKYLLHPDFRKMIFDRETKTGMLEDAIFAPALWCPNDEGTALQYDKAVAGRYAVYDFHRKNEFGERALPRGKGRLIAFPLEEIIHHSAEEYTPSTLVDPLDLGQIMQIVMSPKIEELVGWELIRETTYKEAYQRVGLYDQYKLGIELKDLSEKPIYQITPKGNGLILVAVDGGEATPEKKEARVLVPGWYGNR